MSWKNWNFEISVFVLNKSDGQTTKGRLAWFKIPLRFKFPICTLQQKMNNSKIKFVSFIKNIYWFTPF